MNATLLDIRMNDLTQVLTKLHGRMGNLGSKLTTVITRLEGRTRTLEDQMATVQSKSKLANGHTTYPFQIENRYLTPKTLIHRCQNIFDQILRLEI